MKTLRSIRIKQLLTVAALLFVCVSFASKILHQPGFVKKALCEEASVSDEEEESQENLPLIFVGFELPVPVLRAFSEQHAVPEALLLKEHRSGSWPAMWIRYQQMKIGFAG